MKKLCILAAMLIALVVGINQSAEANTWRFVCVADSIAAQTADTFTVELGTYANCYKIIGFNRNVQTGATDGAWRIQTVFSDGIPTSADEYHTLLTWWESDTAAKDSLSVLNSARLFYVLGFQNSDNEIGDLATIIPGNTLRIYWTPNSVTGGTTSLYLWYQKQD